MTDIPLVRTIGGWLEDAERRLVREDVESPRLSAFLIVEEVTGLDRARVIAHPEECLSAVQLELAEVLLSRRLAHEPMAYLLGRKGFRNLTIKTSQDVLIPRPETEGLVDLAVLHKPNARRIVDAGTGSGCLALSLAEVFPHALVIACDLYSGALHVASENDPHGRVLWIQADWLSAFASDSLDLVVANPPYLTRAEMDSLVPQVSAYEPRAALNASEDGCAAYRTLVPQARRCLVNGGCLLLEVGPSVSGRVRDLLQFEGFTRVRIRRDLAGRERYAEGFVPR